MSKLTDEQMNAVVTEMVRFYGAQNEMMALLWPSSYTSQRSYTALARKIFSVQELPQGALARYDRGGTRPITGVVRWSNL